MVLAAVAAVVLGLVFTSSSEDTDTDISIIPVEVTPTAGSPMKSFLEILNRLGMEKALIVIGGENVNLERSARNVPGVKVLRVEGLNVYDILKYKNLVLLESSIKGIEGRLLA